MVLKQLLLTSLLFLSTAVSGQSLLWQIDGKGMEQPSFLFGTIHLGDPSVIHFDSTVFEKLKSCEVFAMELDPSTFQAMDLFRILQMPDSITASDYLDSTSLQLLDSALDAISGGDAKSLSAFYPIVLSTFFAQDAAGDTDRNFVSVDVYLQQRAQWLGITVASLETLEEQAQALAAIPMAEQYRALIQAIKGTALQEDFTRLQQYYRHQQLDSLYLYTLEGDYWDDGVDSILLDQRNEQMLARMLPLMAEQPVFTAVGAAHLPREKGLLALLRNQGYKVVPLTFEFIPTQD